MADPDEVLSPTDEKANFQRLTRLLMSGGIRLLREIFDKYCPPRDLSRKLSDPSIKKELTVNHPKLTKRQRDTLYPSPGAYGESTDCDITLLFRLLRTNQICNLTPPHNGWDKPLASGDYSLAADLMRIKDYRNKLAHVTGTMDIADDDFQSDWSEIREVLLRIAGHLSREEKKKWKMEIDKSLKSPLTAEDKRNVEELEEWYRQDLELKKTVEEGFKGVETAIEELSRLMLATWLRDSHTTVESGLTEAPCLGIHMQAFAATNPVADFLALLGRSYVEKVNPSTAEEFDGLAQYLDKVRKVIISDIQIGSLTIVVKCSSLQILRELWEDYLSGHLGEMVQKYLVTDNTLSAFGVTGIEIKTSIKEEDYKACEEDFLKRQAEDLIGLAQPEKKRQKKDTYGTKSDQGYVQADSSSLMSDTKPQGVKREQPRISPDSSRETLKSTVEQSRHRSPRPSTFEESPVHKVEVPTPRSPGKPKASSPDEDETPYKRRRTDTMEDKANEDGSEFDYKVAFALDFSKTVSAENLEKERNFSQYISGYWNLPAEHSKPALVVYGEKADTIELDSNITDVSAPPQTRSEFRRMDLALKEAAKHFTVKPTQNQLIVLITAGKQLSGAEGSEGEQGILSSISEELCSRNIKVIIVPVGWETDFKELGRIVKRPQWLFPLKSFDDMTNETAEKIARVIKDTIDFERFATDRLYIFPGVPQEKGLWENISLCSDVMEGAWYLLYDDKKKPTKSQTVKKFIRESIDSFHNTLVTESKICISLAVFGDQGAGKSFFLNFLLNWGLPADQQVENGPLPSALGGSQTPLPIYVKYGKRVQVLLHKQKKGQRDSLETWFPKAKLEEKTLEDVRNLLQRKFQDLEGIGESQDSGLDEERWVELQGPFPVFHGLKNRETTSSGQLELEVEVEFVDVPGYGAKTGNDSISVELSKADVVLFFDSQSQLAKRPVSAEEIAAIFRKHDEFEFTRRPKLVHVVNERRIPTSDIERLLQEKKEDLSSAWAEFFKRKDYKEEREKVPQLNGNALLEKLQGESEVVYFYPAEDCSILKSLKQVINQHVQHVMIKQAVHPFLLKVHQAATRLKTRINRIKTTEKRKHKAIEIKEDVSFQIKPDKNEESELVESFLTQTDLPLHFKDNGDLFGFLYKHFIYSNQTLDFLSNLLRRTLETFTDRMIYNLRNANWSTSKEAPSDLIEVAEILCESRVQQFCATSASAYLIDVLNKGKDRNPFTKKNQKDWSKASDEERKDLCRDFIDILLERTYKSLEKETGERQHKRKSHFTLSELLKQDVKDLLAVRSLNDDADRRALLELLVKKLQEVIQFCDKTIHEINPHPSLDIRKNLSLPEKMADKDEQSIIPTESSHEKIVREVKDLFLKPSPRAAADAIRKLETKLNCGLELPRPHKEENLLRWARVLINVLCDKDHFDIQLEDGFLLDQQDAEVMHLFMLARKRLVAYQKSCVACRIVKEPSASDDVIRLRKSAQKRYCWEVLISPKVSDRLDEIRANFKDPSQNLAPIFIPSIRPGPTPEILGNYFLEEDPWSKGQRMNDSVKEKDKEVLGEEVREEEISSVLNIFLVVEQDHLEIVKDTVGKTQEPSVNNVNLMYVELPQNGRGIGVTRAIIKSLAECFRFSLYWTIDDDIQFMYQFDGNSRRWYKCSIARGLQFGQRVFQTCLEKTVRDLDEEKRADLFDDATSGWEPWAKQIKRSANKLFVDDGSFSQLQRNLSLLHSPFAEAAKACGGDPGKEKKLMDYERRFVAECRKRIFDDTVNHIAGVSLAHESSKRYDYISKYPEADYMCSDQRYQVVLHNAPALQGRNYVADEVLFSDEEFQVNDKGKRHSLYWGIKGSTKSFIHALKLSGVIGYQVIRVVHSHKKLSDAFNRPQTKKDEDENENDDINMEAD